MNWLKDLDDQLVNYQLGPPIQPFPKLTVFWFLNKLLKRPATINILLKGTMTVTDSSDEAEVKGDVTEIPVCLWSVINSNWKATECSVTRQK